MDPIQSWLDADEVRRMAEDLMAPVARINQDSDTGFGENFEGFTGEKSEENESPQEASSPTNVVVETEGIPDIEFVSSEQNTHDSVKVGVGSLLADARRLAEGSGMLSSIPSNSPVRVEVSDKVPDSETSTKAHSVVSEDEDLLSGRLQKFNYLLRGQAGVRGMFLMDSEGEILMDEIGNVKLIQLVRSLVKASNTGVSGSESVHVKIAASTTLEMIPCESRHGQLTLGVICPEPLGVDVIEKISSHLAEVVDAD